MEILSLENSRIGRAGLSPGSAAPPFQLQRLSSGVFDSVQLSGSPYLVVFSSPECNPCTSLFSALCLLSRKAPDVRVVFISRGDLALNRTKFQYCPPSFECGLQRHWEVSLAFQSFATPSAFMVDETGKITAPMAVGVESITNLFLAAAIKNLLTPI